MVKEIKNTMEKKLNIKDVMVVGNILQEANKGEVHSADNKGAAENLAITYSTLMSMENELKVKKFMSDEDYTLIQIVSKAKNVLLGLVSRNLTTWDRNRYFNVNVPEFQSNYGINRDIYEAISDETYIFCRVSNRLNGVELAKIL